MHGRPHHRRVDGPAAAALGRLRSAVLAQPAGSASDDVVVLAPDGRRAGPPFHCSGDQRAAASPDAAAPHQLHLGGKVEDPEAARPWVEPLGARRRAADRDAGPARHPVRTMRRPGVKRSDDVHRRVPSAV